MTDGIDQILDRWREQAASADYSMARAAGDAFERLCSAFLENDPVQSGLYRHVQPWAEWAKPRGYNASDTGIDLVAELKRDPNKYAAIQCKFRKEGGTVAKAEIDSFLAKSSMTEFASRVLIETTGREWSANADEALRGLRPPVVRIGIHELRQSRIRWDRFIATGRPEISFKDRKQPREHQLTAIRNVCDGLAQPASRGKLLMACGTGKTLTSLRIAEELAGHGGRVLYLVPSLALMAQTLREWCNDAEIPLRAYSVCSDAQVGKRRRNENDLIDIDVLDLAFPATTSADELAKRASAAVPEAMIVLFATYQSCGVVKAAQELSLPDFDLVVADEAHRTAGAMLEGEQERNFVLVHKDEHVRAQRRLYMTATPKVYAASARNKAGDLAAALCSMDDEAIYGPVLHELGFGEAVERDLLCDFRVVVLTVPEAAAARLLAGGIEDSQIGLPDAAKLIGCWRALAKADTEEFPDNEREPLRRAIAFCSKIATSKEVAKQFQAVAELHRIEADLAAHPISASHIDGTFDAVSRTKELDWLAEGDQEGCRILCNCRCLTEGVDVPALDAALFMHPRRNQLEVVQAVGRVMRKAEGKRMGYVVLPVAVPDGNSPEEFLDKNAPFQVVWQTLNALRSHDERFDAMIQKMALGDPGDRISIVTLQDWNPQSKKEKTTTGTGNGEKQLEFAFAGLPEAIRAKLVEKCGDRVYWQDWAGDVAAIAQRHISRIRAMTKESDAAQELFGEFLAELRSNLNDSVSEFEAIELLAQHMVTGPVFDALFGDTGFTQRNPVGKGMQDLIDVLKPTGIDAETESLEAFYDSVRRRVEDAKTAQARQAILVELYDSFFRKAFPEISDKLGIVYTPVEIIDFILKSADATCRREFGVGLGAEGVQILDPFTGTGAFIVRLLQLGLIPSRDIGRKYGHELHANEIVLLAYYIASVNIESAFLETVGRNAPSPFKGICLADTFAASETSGSMSQVMPDNSKRIGNQKKLDMRVVVGNPPWRAWQGSSADYNPNTAYPRLRKRIEETYAARSRATLKNSLYDTYKMAIRWASDRVGDRGIVALVTNGSWIEGNADSGIRACIAEEFSTVDVVNLRGNQRTQGERSKQEGGKVFGSGSRAPVAVTILTKNPNATHSGCHIRYCEVDDGMTRGEKLRFLIRTGSTESISDWKEIQPDRHYDWINQRDPGFSELISLGSKEVKSGRGSSTTLFQLYSNGIKTGRDANIYNFGKDACLGNAARAVENYRAALSEWGILKSSGSQFAECADRLVRRNNNNLHWDDGLRNSLKRQHSMEFDDLRLQKVHYRPFITMHAYVEYGLIQRKSQQNRIFPHPSIFNRAICVSGVGSNKPFSVLATDVLPDLELVSKGQFFPRYRYPVTANQTEGNGFCLPASGPADNITDGALQAFRERHPSTKITKDDIFDYVYGILHARDYRERFRDNFSKELPSIPISANYQQLAGGGSELVRLHLGFRTCPVYPLSVEVSDGAAGLPDEDLFRIGTKKMRFADGHRSALRINDFITLHGIPPKAHQYVVNGRTPLEWIMDRYKVTTDKHSGVVNDPNGWFERPEDLIDAVGRAVHLSIETVNIVDSLPPALE